MRNKVLLAVPFLLCLMTAPIFAQPFSDLPWDRAELDRRLNENLALNGDLTLGFSDIAKIGRGYVAPCWAEDTTQIASHVQDGQLIINNQEVRLGVQAVQYYFSGKEAPYRVSIDGNFSDEVNLKFITEFCDSSCNREPVSLLRVSATRFAGEMGAGRPGQYVRNFFLVAGEGVGSIDRLMVTNADEPKLSSINERDQSAVGICYEEVPELEGEWRGMDLILIGLANLFCVGSIAYLLARKFYFPMLIIVAFYITNVLGLLPLYFGMSEPRIMQYVTNRDVLSQLAPASILALAFGALGYLTLKYSVARVPGAWRFSGELNRWLALALFVALASTVLISQLPATLDYYRTSADIGAGAAARAAVVRDSINSETFGLKSHYFRLFFLFLPLLLNLVLVSNALRRRAWWQLPFLICFQVLLFLYNGERAPVAWYGMSVVYVLLAHGATSWKWFWPTTLAFVVSVILVLSCGPSALRLMADRTVFGAATVGYYILDLFPAQHDFLGGRALGRLSVGSAVPFNLNLFLWRNIFPASYFSHLSGTATGAVWTQGYINYGWIGAAGFAYAFGAIVAAVHTAVARLFRADTMVAVVSVLVFHYSSLGESNFDRFVLDFYMAGLIVLALAVALVVPGLSRLIGGLR